MRAKSACRRSGLGSILFSYALRPFILCGAVWAAASMLVFLLRLVGSLEHPTIASSVAWHAHEMTYG